MLNRYFIIDDFYRDPDRLVETALKSPKEGSSRGKYAGVMTLDSFLSNEQRLFFENLLDEKPINSATQLNGRIRFSTPGDYYKQNINVIDSAHIVAKYIRNKLKENDLLSNTSETKHHFYVSNYTESFEKSAKFFFKEDIKLEEEVSLF